MAWRNAQASMTLVAEINARWPRRDKSSDGTIGDAAHAARTSDHNPWLVKSGQGIVRARDVDKDGIDAPWIVEYLRSLGARRDPRLWPNGYVIFNRRITKPDFSGWRAYTGSNPHDHHFHVSFSTDTSAAGFDSAAPWGIAGAAAPAPAKPAATPAPALVPTPVHPFGEDTAMHVYSAEPARDAQGRTTDPKNRWPTRTVTFGFDPATTKDLRLHWGSRGGWLHSARWWVRDTGWSPNNPKHHPQDHNVGQGGSERFVGFGWVAGPPPGADELEVTFSAPDGLHVFPAGK